MLPYISIAEAVGRKGLRLVLSAGVPGPWGEAAKAIFDIKGIDYIPVEHKTGVPDQTLRQWTGQESAPAAMFESERPRTRWDEILLLAERLQPAPSLIPKKQSERADMFGLAHAICSEDGLGWNLRLCLLEAQAKAAASGGGFVSAEQLRVFNARYGHGRDDIREPRERIVAILGLLADRLRSNLARGSRYMVGDELTALDIYWTVFSNLVCPIAQESCPMPDAYRQMGERMGDELGQALNAILIDHRDDVLARHFKLPMRF